MHQRARSTATARCRNAPGSSSSRAPDRTRGPGRRKGCRTRPPTSRSPVQAATAPARRCGRPRPASRRPGPPPSRARETPACSWCSASRANTRTRSRARPATAAPQVRFNCHAANTNTIEDTITNSVASRAAERAARDLAHRGPRIEGVHPRIDQPVEAHRGTARRHHRDDHPEDLPPGKRRLLPRQQRAGQRKRQREHRMAEADERQVGGETVHGLQGFKGSRVLAGSGFNPFDLRRLNAAQQELFDVVDILRAGAPRSFQPVCRASTSRVIAKAQARARRRAWRSRESLPPARPAPAGAWS